MDKNINDFKFDDLNIKDDSCIFDTEYILMLSNVEKGVSAISNYEDNLMDSLILGFWLGLVHSKSLEIETNKLKTVIY